MFTWTLCFWQLWTLCLDISAFIFKKNCVLLASALLLWKAFVLTCRPTKRKKALTSISRENVKSVYWGRQYRGYCILWSLKHYNLLPIIFLHNLLPVIWESTRSFYRILWYKIWLNCWVHDSPVNNNFLLFFFLTRPLLTLGRSWVNCPCLTYRSSAFCPSWSLKPWRIRACLTECIGYYNLCLLWNDGRKASNAVISSCFATCCCMKPFRESSLIST